MASELDPPVGTARAGAGGGWAGLLAECRPRQWVKNLLVFAAPGAAGVLSREHVAASAALAGVAFCLVSSGTYLLNDVRDRARDRRHPVKRLRPIASGALAPRTATVAAAVLIAAGLGLAGAIGPALVATIAGYLAVTGAYTLWLREVAIFDAAAISAGFILRAVAGGAATGVHLSEWFLIVTSFSALFVVAGKRASELAGAGQDGGTRGSFVEYSPSYLRFMWTMAATVAIGAYCIWAFARAGADEVPWMELSIVPFVLGVMRYALLVDHGAVEMPERVMSDDRPLQLIALAWLAVFALGAYAVG